MPLTWLNGENGQRSDEAFESAISSLLSTRETCEVNGHSEA